MGTGGHRSVDIALHQAESLQAFGHQAAHREVHIHVFHPGARHFERQVVAVHHNVVDIALALAEAARNGRGARVVGAVVLARFGTGIDQEQARGIERGRRGEAVQHFAVHRYDGGEGNHATARRGNTVERTGDGGFGHAGLYGHAHGSGVHLITDGGGAVEFGYFLLALDVAQCHHGTNEFDARRLAHLQGV